MSVSAQGSYEPRRNAVERVVSTSLVMTTGTPQSARKTPPAETGWVISYVHCDTIEICRVQDLCRTLGCYIVMDAWGSSSPGISRRAIVLAPSDRHTIPNLRKKQLAADRPDTVKQGLRPGQRLRRQLHVGHDRHRHRRGRGARAPRAGREPRDLGPRLRSRGRRKAEGLRHPRARRAGGSLPHRAELSRPRPGLEGPGRPAAGRRSPRRDGREGVQKFPLVGIHPSAAGETGTFCVAVGLFRATLLQAQARAEEAEQRRRDRLRRARGRRAPCEFDTVLDSRRNAPNVEERHRTPSRTT